MTNRGQEKTTLLCTEQETSSNIPTFQENKTIYGIISNFTVIRDQMKKLNIYNKSDINLEQGIYSQGTF